MSDGSQIDFSQMTDDELFSLARRSNVAVYERCWPVVQRVAKNYCKRYRWIDPNDLSQDLMVEIPKIMYAYREDNPSKTTWSKFLYHKLFFKSKDVLRREDPLGVSFPQKREYPRWHRLQDESLSGFDIQDHRDAPVMASELEDDIERWRAYFASLPPIPKFRKRKKKKKRSEHPRMHLMDWYWRRHKPKQMEMFT